MNTYHSPVSVTAERIRFDMETEALRRFIQAVGKIGRAASDYFLPDIVQQAWQDEEGDVHHGPGGVHGYDIGHLYRQTRDLQDYELYLRVHELLSVPSPNDGIRLGVVDFQDVLETLVELEKRASGDLSTFLHLAADFYVQARTLARLDEPGKQLFQERQSRLSTLDEAFGQAFGLEDYMQTFLQMTLARVVENFEVYLSELMRLVLRTHSRSLDSTEVKLTVEQIRQFKTVDDMITDQIDKRVNELGYAGSSAIQKYVDKNFKFKLFQSAEQLERAEVYVQLRHIMVHNRGKVNEIFIGRLQAQGINVEQYESQLGKPVPLTEQLVAEAVKLHAAWVNDIDQRAIAKWKLHHHGPGLIELD